VNLFWNPRNRTFEAFQRNALLGAAEAGDARVRTLCILEVDVESVLADETTYWSASQGNIAAGHQPTCELPSLVGYPWEEIFTAVPSAGSRASAAELLLFLKASARPHSAPVSAEHVKRVIVAEDARRHLEQVRLPAGTTLLQRSDMFKSEGELLHAETKFLGNMADVARHDGHLVARLRAIAQTFRDLERVCSKTDKGPSECVRAARGWHGMGHAVRTMFWAVYLATCAVGLGHMQAQQAAALCALVHDRSRKSTGPDPGHGAAAADSHRVVFDALRDPRLRLSCENAVRFHDRDDAECLTTARDWLWEGLKDADALDRGRFGPPNTEGGCREDLLRMTWLGDSTEGALVRRRLAWAGYYLARITESSQWGEPSCQRLLTDIRVGLRAGLRAGVFPLALQRLAEQISDSVALPPA
jgi:hypothetical protein